MRSLTPLWLGDIDRDSAHIKESGLIGSLRFWYEGLLRGYGIAACNPLKTREGCTCAACDLFGSTGRARQFRISLEGLDAVPIFFRASPAVAASTGNWLWNIFGGEETGGRKARGATGKYEFTFGVKALWSATPFTIMIYPRPSGCEWVPGVLAVLLQELATKGGIGAKTQYGFGQVALESAVSTDPDFDLERLIAKGRSLLESKPRGGEGHSELFSLAKERFFSRTYEVPEPSITQMVDIGKPPSNYDRSYIPCAFDIRYKYQLRNPRIGQGVDAGLRPAIRDRFGSDRARNVFGFVSGGEARASRVHVSHLFRQPGKPYYRLKVWGDVSDKADIAGTIEQHLLKRFARSRVVVQEA